MEVKVDDVYASFPGVEAVRGVSLDIPAGQVVAIVGPNGCGKSTLLKVISRLHRPDQGAVLHQGDDVWSLKPREVAHRIALLPQSPVAPEAMTVRRLISFGRHPHQGLFRQWSTEDDEAVSQAMADTGTLELADRPLETLSGGQRQRCWLAMCLAQTTPVLALDEPTSALDMGHAVEVMEHIREAAQAGRTAIMVVHDLVSAARYADVVVAMKAGEVIAQGPPNVVVTTELVTDLYGIASDVVCAPSDGVPIVIPQLFRLGYPKLMSDRKVRLPDERFRYGVTGGSRNWSGVGNRRSSRNGLPRSRQLRGGGRPRSLNCRHPPRFSR